MGDSARCIQDMNIGESLYNDNVCQALFQQNQLKQLNNNELPVTKVSIPLYPLQKGRIIDVYA